MKKSFLAPLINNNDRKIQVVHWHVKDLDYITTGQEIVEVETSKAIVTLDAIEEGYIKIIAGVDAVVEVGAVLATVYSDTHEYKKDNEPDEPKEKINELGITKAKIVNSSVKLSSKKTIPDTVRDKGEKAFNTTRLSKLAQDYVNKHDIDVSIFEKRGLITKKRIEEHFSKKSNDSFDMPVSQIEKVTDFHSIKISLAKQVEIEQLSLGESGNINSSLSIQFKSVGIRKTLDFTGSLQGQELSLIVFEISRLLEEYPNFVAFFRAGEVVYYDSINIGIAMDLGNGLKVPVVKDANVLFAADIKEIINDFSLRCLENNLGIDDLSNGTFTITDLSSENISHFEPLINGHQSMIIGIGGDSAQEGHPITITAVFDHRVTNGREVSEFLNKLKSRLLSYEMENLPTAKAENTGKGIICCKCHISLHELNLKFAEESLMLSCVKKSGDLGYICHICIQGY